MAKQIRYDIKLNVDGKDVVASSVKDVKDLDKSVKDLSHYKGAFNDIVESSKPLKRQLSDLKKMMAEMEFKGLAGTDEFKAIAQQAGQMADAIGDANAQVKYFANDTKTLSTVVSGFQAVASSIQLVQGAMALFGAENKEAAEVLKKVQGAMALANGVQQVANLLNKDSALIQGVVNMQRKIAATLASKNAAAIAAETTATKGATIATKALNAVMKANPIGLVITAITTLIGLFAIFSSSTDDSTERLKKQEDEVGKLTKSWENLRDRVGSAAGDMVSKFQTLALQWSMLRTEGERQQWITKNASNFEQLGLKIMDVTTANKVFIDQLPRMITLMQKMGELKGLEAAYSQVQSDYFSWLLKREKSRATGDYYTKATEQNITKAEREELGIGRQIWVQDSHTSSAGFGTGYYSYEYSADELRKVNAYREKQAKDTRDAILKQAEEEYGAASAEYKRLYEQLYGEVSAAGEELNKIFGQSVVYNPATTASPYGKASKTSAPSTKAAKVNSVKAKAPQNARDVKKEVSEKLTELEKLQKERDEIQKELDNPKFAKRLTKYEKNTRSERIKELDAEIARIKEWTGEMAFVKDLNDNELVIPLEFTIDKEKTIKNLSAPGLFTDIKPIAIDNLLSSGERNSIDVNENSRNGIQQVVEWFDAGLIGKDRASEFIAAFNAQMMAVGLEPIEVDLQANAMRKQITDVTDTVNILSSSLGTAFGAFNQLMKGDGEDEYGLMVGQIIAQTIATLSLSFANAMKSASSNWVTWLAFGLTGAAQLTSMIAQIKGLNSEGYASGGIIPGSSTSGDRVLARVNSGEMILNTIQQKRLFGMLNGTVPAAGATPTASLGMLRNSLNNGGNVTMTVSGRNLVGVLSNETRVSSKSGRKTNIKI